MQRNLVKFLGQYFLESVGTNLLSNQKCFIAGAFEGHAIATAWFVQGGEPHNQTHLMSAMQKRQNQGYCMLNKLACTTNFSEQNSYSVSRLWCLSHWSPTAPFSGKVTYSANQPTEIPWISSIAHGPSCQCTAKRPWFSYHQFYTFTSNDTDSLCHWWMWLYSWKARHLKGNIPEVLFWVCSHVFQQSGACRGVISRCITG